VTANQRLLTTAAACLTLTTFLAGAQEAATSGPSLLHRVAKPVRQIAGAPRASDVCMRSLRPRPTNARDPHNTLDAIRGFHVTWLEWTYGNDKGFIRKVHDMGATYGGALAAGSYRGKQSRAVWNVRDREGNPVYATWMRAWKTPNAWGCANHPEFRAGHVRDAVAAVAAGADVLQRDEPGQNKHAVRWGGCFCEHCMKGFNQWLATNGDPAVLRRLGVADLKAFDYREHLRAKDAPIGDAFGAWKGDELKAYFVRFQTDSSVAFARWWREELNKKVGREIPISCNNGTRQWTDIELTFDYCIGELSTSHATPKFLYAAMRKAAALDRTQSVTMPLRRTGEEEAPDWVQHTRQSIATVYATGGHIEMPWDTYLPTPNGRRYFGKPENYADLTAFVRGMAPFLDGYSDAFAVGGEIMDERWLDATPPVTPLTDAAGIVAFARAVPGNAAAPVAVHLVDWREQTQPFTLSLHPPAFFAGRPLRVRLFTPVLPHDQKAHGEAFRTKDYRSLVRETELSRGFVNTVEIPALGPWGVLVVDPDPTAATGIWPPSFVTDDLAFHQEARVALACATPGVRMHYTLDGSAPVIGSPRYTGSLTIRDSRTVSAISVLDGIASAPVSARFVKRERPAGLIANGEFDQGLTGWKRVVFPQAGEDALAADPDDGRKLSGPNSARLIIRRPTGTVYHLRLTHPFTAKPGVEYTLTFRAMADGPVHCRVGLQAANAPHKVLGMRHQSIGRAPRRYTVHGRGLKKGDADSYLVQFDVGAALNAGRTLWIDDVHLAENAE
jgi:hypothetical protein